MYVPKCAVCVMLLMCPCRPSRALQTFLDTVPGQYEKAKTKALCVIEQELKQIGCTIEEVATIV